MTKFDVKTDLHPILEHLEAIAQNPAAIMVLSPTDRMHIARMRHTVVKRIASNNAYMQKLADEVLSQVSPTLK